MASASEQPIMQQVSIRQSKPRSRYGVVAQLAAVDVQVLDVRQVARLVLAAMDDAHLVPSL